MIFLTKPSQIILFTITIAVLAVSISAKPILSTLQADLLPITNNFKDNGVIFVVNQGAIASTPTWLTLNCATACPKHSSLEEYSQPLFPNSLTIQIPALKSGQVFKHQLPFWGSFDFNEKQDSILLFVDAGNVVVEMNEKNNRKRIAL